MSWAWQAVALFITVAAAVLVIWFWWMVIEAVRGMTGW